MKKLFKKYLNVKLLLLLIGLVIAKIVITRLFKGQNKVTIKSNTNVKTTVETSSHSSASATISLTGKDIVEALNQSFQDKVSKL